MHGVWKFEKTALETAQKVVSEVISANTLGVGTQFGPVDDGNSLGLTEVFPTLIGAIYWHAANAHQNWMGIARCKECRESWGCKTLSEPKTGGGSNNGAPQGRIRFCTPTTRPVP